MPVAECSIHERVLALATGLLPEADEEKLLVHVEQCDDCRATLDAAFQPRAERGQAKQPSLDPKSIVDDPAFQLALAEIEQFEGAHAVRLPAASNHQRAKQVDRDFVGQHVGQYEIVDKLGSGGMGTVYKARDPRLKRLVALKLVHVNRSGPDSVARFRAEAETIARLSHVNIVQIYEVGDHEGLPYFVLELVEGGSLAEYAKRDPLPARQAAEIVMGLALAVDYAHQRGIVHRDLKPGNVLVTSPIHSTGGDDSTQRASTTNLTSSTLAASSSTSTGSSLGAILKITDFGLAKQLDADSDMTRSGTIMGTPSYMSPEQARGEVRRVGPAADIYALGAILYSLVTGRPPFVGENYVQTISMVIDDEPLPPSRLQPRLPTDVETICLKCLAKQPGKRYGSAAELAEDLKRFLKCEPILARPVGSAERLAKLVRRRPTLAALVAVVAAIVVVGLPTVTTLYVNSEFHRRAAVKSQSEESKARKQAQQSDLTAKQQVARLRAAQGVALMNEGQLFESLIWTSSALEEESRLRGDSQEGAAHAEQVQQFRFAAALQQCPALVAAWKVPGAHAWDEFWRELPEGFYFSPDGQFVCIRGLRTQEPGMPNVPIRWRASDGQVVPSPIDADEDVILRKATQDGRLEAVAYQDFRIKVWDIATGISLHEFDIPKEDLGIEPEETFAAGGLEISPDHRFLALAIRRTPLVGLIWDLDSGQLRWHGAIGPSATIEFTRDSQQAFLGRTTLWNASTGQVTEWPLSVEHSIAFETPLSPNGRWIAYLYLHHPQRSQGPPRLPDGTIEIRDTQTSQFQVLEPRHRSPVSQFAYDPTSRWFLAGDRDGNVQIWDMTNWRMYTALQHRGRNWTPTFSPDGRWIALSSRGNSVRVWDVDQGRPITPSLPHPEMVRGAAWAPDGHRLAVLGMNGAVRIWDLARQGQPTKTLHHPSPLYVVRFSLDDHQLATGCLDATAHVWNVASGQPIGSPMQHEESVIALSWDRMGEQLATVNGRNSYGLHGNAFQIWRPATGEAVTPSRGRKIGAGFGVGRVQFSPTANQLLVQYAGRANIHDLTKRKDIGLIMHPGPGGSIFGELHYSVDGRRLITVKGSVCVWDMPSGKLRRHYEVEGMPAVHQTNDVAPSRNGRYFAVASSEGLIVLEVPDDPQDMRTLIQRPSEGPIGLVSFDSANCRLLSVDINGACQIWDLQTAEPLGPRWETGSRARFAGFGPNDDWIVTVLTTGEIQLWDPKTGQPLCPPRQHGAHVNDAVLSHSGFLLATAGVDGAVRLWDLCLEQSHLPERMSHLARLLTSQQLSGDALAPISRLEFESLDIDRARREFPKMFSVSQEDVAKWHLRRAADCLTCNEKDAAMFHFDRARERLD